MGWLPGLPVRRRRWLIVVALVGLALLAGCTVAPPPPLVPASVAKTSQVRSPDTTSVVVGVDGIAGGYNPHELADQSSTTTALATLLLPSVFRTAPDGTPQLDQTVAVSAQVTNASPFTVTYTLRTDATWSDGTPVDAADFYYLWQQMQSQPGVIDPAGYQLISKITARDNAKVVTVTFSQPYPAWRSLFDNLLPAHLLKDAPGGFASALDSSFPATAGPFDIKNLDTGGGEIVLERSDRYWGKPSVLDQIVLTKSDHQTMADALRSQADQLVYTRVDSAADTLLHNASPSVTVTTVPRAELATVLLRPASPQLADQSVRTAVAAAIDRSALIATGTGGGPSVRLPANALVVPPSATGYTATMPAGAPGSAPNPGAVAGLLAQAGYVHSGTAWTRGGHQLSLVIAAPANREPYVSMANQLRAQLVAAGIPATVVTPSAAQLYQQSLGATQPAGSGATDTSANNAGTGTGPIDILVGPQPVGPDAASDLASWFGCVPTAPAAPAAPGGTQPPATATNPLGWCDQAVQADIIGALTGTESLTAALGKVETQLWAQAVAIPLFQVSDQLAVGHQVTGVDGGPPLAGPFFGAANWSRPTG